MSKTVLIGAYTALNTSATSPNSLASGELGVFSIASDGTFTALNSSTAAAANTLPILIAQGVTSSTTTNYRGVILQPRSVIASTAATTGLAYTSSVPNVYTIGYTGISGNTDTIVGATAGAYGININNMSKGVPPFPFTSWNKSYSSAGAATPTNIAYDMMKGVNANTLNNIATGALPEESFVWASLVTESTFTQLATSAPANITGTVTNGSTAVTLSGTPASALAAGSWVRIGNATTGVGAPVYKVASQSGTSLVLDSPYVNGAMTFGASQASVALGTASSLGSYVGVRFVCWGNSFNGIPVEQLTPNKQMYVFASGNLYDLGNVIANNLTAPKPYLSSTGTVLNSLTYYEGRGLGYQVQKEEFISMGYFGMNNRVFLPFSNPYYAAATSNYDGYAFKYRGTWEDKTGAGNRREEISEVEIFAVNSGTSGTIGASSPLVASTGIPAIIAAWAA